MQPLNSTCLSSYRFALRLVLSCVCLHTPFLAWQLFETSWSNSRCAACRVPSRTRATQTIAPMLLPTLTIAADAFVGDDHRGWVLVRQIMLLVALLLWSRAARSCAVCSVLLLSTIAQMIVITYRIAYHSTRLSFILQTDE